MEAVNETCIHDVVHTTVTHVATLLAILGEDGVVVLLLESFLLLSVDESVCIEVVYLRSIGALEYLT